MTLKHASIVPLIGGETIAQQQAFGSLPDYLLSYTPFEANDRQLVNYYKNEVPYILLDQGGRHPHQVDIVNAVCPCAGLSSLSTTANSNAAVNDWMIKSAQYVLEEVQPQVFWGENAPRFAGEMGKPIVAKLMDIAKRAGYTMSIYRTKSLLHGLSQVRERSFYFFWKGSRIPLLNYFHREHERIEDTIRKVPKEASQNDVLTNKKTPSVDDPYYRYVLEVMEGGITHKQFFEKIKKSQDVMDYIETNKASYFDVAKWMRANGHSKQADRCEVVQKKLDAGGNVMRRNSTIPKDYIGAFVGHLPSSLTHPDEDRYLTVREAMSIMGLPHDFELLNPVRNLNHICQNVPVSTARDMANEVKEYLQGNRDTVRGELVYQYNSNKTHVIRDTESISTLETFI